LVITSIQIYRLTRPIKNRPQKNGLGLLRYKAPPLFWLRFVLCIRRH